MAAFVKSVERVATTLPTSANQTVSTTTNLTKGQDVSKCVPFLTSQFPIAAGDNRGNNPIAGRIIDNSGTAAIEVSKWNSSSAPPGSNTEISIVEFGANVTIQSGGPVTMTGDTVNQSITSVNQSNSFIVFSYRAKESGVSSNFDEILVDASFSSNTQISFERWNSGSIDLEIFWHVIESDGVDFQSEFVPITIPNGSEGETANLSNSVNLDHSFIVPSYRAESRSTLRDNGINFALINSTTIEAYRDHGGRPRDRAQCGVWVVRSDSSGFSTQRLTTDVSGTSPIDQTIASVDLNKAAVVSGNHVAIGDWAVDSNVSSQNINDRMTRIYLTSSTNVRASRFDSGSISGSVRNLRYEIVEFELEAAGPGPQIVPVGLVEETDSVFAVDPVITGGPQTVIVGTVEETDAVLAVTPVAGGVTLPVGLVEETDSVFAVTPQTGGAPQTVPIDLITEVDSVQAVTPLAGEVTVAVGIVTETDEVFPVTPVPGAVSIPVDIVEELDQVAPVFPVVEGGPQTVLVVNVAEIDTVFPVTPRLEPEEEDIKGGIPQRRPRNRAIRRRRKRRRYILPDGRVYTDPERALYELRALLKAERAAGESGGEAAISETTPASLGQEISPPDTAPDQPVTPQMLQTAISELPELLLASPEDVPSLDPQLISVLFQMIDDEEAAMLLL